MHPAHRAQSDQLIASVEDLIGEIGDLAHCEGAARTLRGLADRLRASSEGSLCCSFDDGECCLQHLDAVALA